MWKRRYRRFVIRNSSRERRRSWVTVMYAGLAGWTISSLLLGLVFSQDNIPLWLPETSLIFFAVGFLLWGWGFAVTLMTSSYVSHGRLIFSSHMEPQDRKLDERQRAMWHRASRAAYLVVLGVLLVAHLYWAFVHPFLGLTGRVPMGLFSLAILLLAVSLPNAIVAWTEPSLED